MKDEGSARIHESERKYRPAVKVATYNIHQCVGTDGLCDPDRVGRVIRGLNADVVGLQEVFSRTGEGRIAAQMDYLAWVTGFKAVPGTTFHRGKGQFGNVLLTNSRILETRTIDISFRDREPRGVIDAVLEVQSVPLRIIVTHLGLTRVERRLQVRRLLHILTGGNSLPTVILGDINEWLPLSLVLRTLDGLFGKTRAHATFPSRFPIFALDRIWVRPPALIEDMEVYKRPPAREASDHLPLVATLSL